MSADFSFRLIGMVVFAILGAILGDWLGRFNPEFEIIYTLTVGLVGALFGLVLTPYFTSRPIRTLKTLMGKLAAETLFSAIIGLVVGLIIAALLAFPLSLLPYPFGKILPFIGVILFCYFGVALFVMRQTDMGNLFSGISSRREEGGQQNWSQANRTVLLDTSVIIDGRVADIAKTGFLPGTLLIPRFV